MGAKRRLIGRRVPKPKAEGSNPSGATKERKVAATRRLRGDLSAGARRSLRASLIARGFTASQSDAVVKCADDIFDAARRVRDEALSELVRNVAQAVVR